MKISLQGVVKRFGATTAVDRTHLEIADGELFTLLGPSGCGKTTLLRLIAGFYSPPDEGTIHFGERRVERLPPYERNIGMVFQNYALWPHMTVGANITYGLRLRKLPADEIAAPARARPAAGEPRRAGRALSGPAVRRSAAAGGAGPRAGAESRHPAARRAAVQSRREDPGAGARGDPPAAAGAAHHDRLRHPRSGGGAVALRPRGGDARRAHPAGGHAAGAVRAAGQPLRGRFRRHQQLSSPESAPSRGAGASSWTRRWARSRPGRWTRSAPASAACWRCGRRTWCSAAAARTPSADASRSPPTSATPCATTSRRSPGSCIKVDVRDSWHHRLLPVGEPLQLGFPASAVLTLPDE